MKTAIKLFVHLTILFLGFFLWKKGILRLDFDVELGWFCLSIIPLFCGFILQAYQWQKILACQNLTIKLKDSIISIGLTIFGKYIPGKIWLIIGRAAFIASLTKSSISNLSLISLLSQLFTLWTGLLIGFLLLLSQTEAHVFASISFLMFAVLSMIIFNKTINRLIANLVFQVFRRKVAIPSLSWQNFQQLILPYLITWASWSIGFYFLLVAFKGQFVHLSALAIFPLAATLGIVAVISPGGLGVREAAIVLLLSTIGFSTEEATSLSALQRIWFLIGEAFIFILALSLNKFHLHFEETQ